MVVLYTESVYQLHKFISYEKKIKDYICTTVFITITAWLQTFFYLMFATQFLNDTSFFFPVY